jgi:UDP-N-acetylglucosamine 2-epimerase (non-hydrolysing)
MKKILVVYGTRPEAIKMAPLILELLKHSESFSVEVCLTGQHRQMLDQVNSFFGIKANYDLNLMQPNQTLSDLTARCLVGLGPILEQSNPDLVFLQGDTTTVLAGALAAFYRKIPVAHLEAGLRSGNIYSPYPEEINRKVAGQIAAWHFAPTVGAAENLKRDGIINNVYVVGNTVIDGLHLGLKLIHMHGDFEYKKYFSNINFEKKLILVTGHRRESFGEGFENICYAIKNIAIQNSNIEIIYPVHLNPNVVEPVNRLLKGLPNVHLIQPLDYPYLIWLMEKSYFVLTDSGGIQEEAPALGKPVLVMREVTERMEGVIAGTAQLVGTDPAVIMKAASELLHDTTLYTKMAHAVNPYGDGKSSMKIVEILEKCFKGKQQ